MPSASSRSTSISRGEMVKGGGLSFGSASAKADGVQDSASTGTSTPPAVAR
jgi:hypothetical protein